MADLQLTLTEDERAILLEFLETALKDVLVEEHRTRAPSYREIVKRREDVIARLLDKVKQAPK